MPLKFSIKLFLTCLSLTFLSVNLYSQDSATSQDDGLWSLVMTKMSNSPGIQRWNRTTHFPKDEIQKAWDESHFITQLSYKDNQWILISNKSKTLNTQSWFTRKTIDDLETEIKKSYDNGQMMTNISYGNGLWLGVMSKGTPYGRQLVQEHRYEFPVDYFNEKMDEGLYLTDIAYGDGKWVSVFSQDVESTAWMAYVHSSFPEEKIKEYWDLGYSINVLKHFDDLWVLSMIKNPNYQQQIWRTREQFPKDEIKEFWDQGYTITDISFKDNSNETDYSIDEIYYDQNELVGSWKPIDGTNISLIFGNDMYHVFFDNTNGTISGGENFEIEKDITVDVMYEIDTEVYPKRYDVVIYLAGYEMSRQRCIYKIESGILTVKCPENLESFVKTTNFDLEDGFTVNRYKKNH